MSHQCAVPRCTSEIPWQQVMCEPHWSRVPAAIQEEIAYHWRLFGLGQCPRERAELAVRRGIRAVHEAVVEVEAVKAET